ncbi:MAG: S8 family serine peptidase [Coriobacteriales bacterium]|nr:S8 family serine peptidase [Coriobacteriales bacterium]
MKKRSFIATAVCAASLCAALGLGMALPHEAPTPQPTATVSNSGTQETAQEPQDPQGSSSTSAVSASEAAAASAATSVTPASAVATTPEAAPAAASVTSDPVVTVTTVSQDETFEMPEDAEYEPEVALIQVSEEASLDEINASLQAGGSETAQMVAVEEVAQGCVRVELAEGSSVEDAVNDLMDQGIVAAAQPNYCYTVNDNETLATKALQDNVAAASGVANAASGEEEPSTSFSELVLEAAGVSVNDPKVGEQWALSSMGVFDAWSQVMCNNSVTVALLDLGCEVSHEDLKANIVAPYNSYNALHGGSTTDVSPLSSNPKHGTHVAGIVAATANNGIGVSGASYNARIMPVKVVDSSGNAYTQELVKAYDYLISQKSTYNVRVANLSMGIAGTAGSDDALYQAIDRAYAQGIVTVAAAGNAYSGVSVPYDCYPGDYGTVVSVISLKQTSSGLARSDNSNYNASGERDKNISAPGNNIYSTIPGSYGTLTGTSMAAPQVSSVLALEFAANPNLSASEAVNILYSTATDIGSAGWDATYGYGEVNANAAVAAAKQAAGGTVSVESTTTGGNSSTGEVRTCPCYNIYK